MVSQFSGQREGENLVFVFRKHIITMWRGVFGLFFFGAIGFVPLIIVPNNTSLIFVGLGGAIVGLLIFFHHWISWYFTIYIITNQRVRQNLQKGLFHKSVVDINIDKVQSALVKINGMLGNLMGFGTLVLHTQVGDLVINKVSRVEKVYAKLQDEIGKAEYREGSNEEK
jgi:Predicted membrane protein